MAPVTIAAIDKLTRHRAHHCVSIVVPVDRGHPNNRASHLEFKRLVALVRDQLKATGAIGIDQLLEPAEAILKRPVLTEHSGGLALFLAPGFTAEYTLDEPVESVAATGDQFTIGPLLSTVEVGKRCHVLTVGADNVALFAVDRANWSECAVPDLPSSLDETLWFERSERMSSGHAGGPIGATGMSIIGHGSGAQDEDRKEQLGRFLHRVDQAVAHHLRGWPAGTLVVAGTHTVVARYQKVTRLPHIITAAIGSPAELSTREIRERVEEVIARLFAHTHDAVVERLVELLGTGLASTDTAELFDAATSGRVSDLLVAAIKPAWRLPGKPSEPLDDWQPGATDVINDIICDSWRHGAHTHRLSGEQMPDGHPLAGLFRY
ncbi:MAG: hypothetical protein WEB78_12190 [Ilumatobacteraceae bacterium]